MIRWHSWYWLVVLSALLVAMPSRASALVNSGFDHQHTAFTGILQQHVVTFDNGLKAGVDYPALAADPKPLNAYLQSLSAVSPAEFNGWSTAEQLSFLINAYNGFTLQLIVDNYPQFAAGDADSIRDLGSLFSSPWEIEFFTLLGAPRHLDWLEHETIRQQYDEPRIHAALVCAAISCPPLRPEAFVAHQLDQQLDDQMRIFLSDRNINGINAEGLYLSKIFDWYGSDFGNLQAYLTRYSSALTDNPAQAERLQTANLKLRFTDYNWQLNLCTQ